MTSKTRKVASPGKPAKKKRLNRVVVTQVAWDMSQAGHAFTTADIAEKCHIAVNRHLQGYMNQLAQLGLLAVRRPLCADGHYRKYFMSHQTAALYPNIQEKMFK